MVEFFCFLFHCFSSHYISVFCCCFCFCPRAHIWQREKERDREKASRSGLWFYLHFSIPWRFGPGTNTPSRSRAQIVQTAMQDPALLTTRPWGWPWKSASECLSTLVWEKVFWSFMYMWLPLGLCPNNSCCHYQLLSLASLSYDKQKRQSFQGRVRAHLINGSNFYFFAFSPLVLLISKLQ